jgi:myosin heavy subunit
MATPPVSPPGGGGSTPDPRKIQQLADLLERVDGYSASTARSMANAAAQAGVLDDELTKVAKRQQDLNKGFQSIVTSLKDSVKELNKLNTSSGQVTNSFNELDSLASKVLRSKKDIKNASSEELKNIQKSIIEEVQNLKLQREKLTEKKRSRGLNEEEKKQLAAINNIMDAQGNLRKKTASGEENYLKTLQEETKELEKQAKIEENIEKTKTAGKDAAAGISKALESAFGVGAILEFFKGVDDRIGDLGKNLNMTYNQAADLNKQFADMGSSMNDAFLNSKSLGESFTAISQDLGVSVAADAEAMKEELATFTKLRDQAGFTNEELTKFYKLGLVNNKTLEQTTEEFLGGAKALSAQKGLAINVKQLMKETANASSALKLTLSAIPGGLAKAAVEAKALGVSLEQLENIQQGLLNFEDSISAELEAELLTGKEINLEKARLAALNGDIGEMAKELNAELGGSAEFNKMNVIQQEAMAKAVGMTREELAKSLIEQEALQSIGVATAEAAKEKYDNLRSSGLTAEQAAVELGNEQLAQQYEQASIQEKFNATLESAKDIFVQMGTGPLQMISNLMTYITKHMTAIKVIAGIIAGIFVGKWAAGLAKSTIGLIQMIPKLATALGLSTARATAETTAAEAATLGGATVGILAGLATVGAAMYAAFSSGDAETEKLSKTNDGIIGPQGYGRVLSDGRGGIQTAFADEDHIIASTNNPMTVPSNNNAGMMAMVASMQSATEKAISGMQNTISSIANKPVNVSMNIDGTKVGEAAVNGFNNRNLTQQTALQ